MIDPSLINRKDAIDSLSKIIDKVPKGKRAELFVETCCVELTIVSMSRLLDAIRKWHFDTYGDKAEEAAFVKEIDKLVPRKKA